MSYEAVGNSKPDIRAVVYLAGHKNLDAYRKVASAYLLSQGYGVVDPFRQERDFRGREEGHANEIVDGDLEDIRQSHIVLANLTTPSAGTSMECWFAYSIGRVVVPFVESDESVSPWIEYISTSLTVERTLADALLWTDFFAV